MSLHPTDPAADPALGTASPDPSEADAALWGAEAPSILALDNVALDLPLAGLGTRSLALLVDGVILALIAVAWGIFIGTLSSFSNLSGAWLAGIGLFGYFLLQWGYFSACEIFLDGRTPGKMALSLQTVTHLGGRPSVGALLIRNLLRPIDYVFGIFFMALDPRSRRLGDMVASTLVAHRGLDDPSRRRLRIGRRPESWGPDEIALVEAFVARAERLEPERARYLAGELVGWILRTEPAFVAEAEGDVDRSLSPEALSLEAQYPEAQYPDALHHLWSLLAVREVDPAAFGGFAGDDPGASPDPGDAVDREVTV